MHALHRSIALLFVLFAVASAALTATGGAAPSPTTEAVGPDVFQQADENASANASNAPNASTASVVLENQTRDGRSVYVGSATLPDGGFVVLAERDSGDVVGVSLYLDPGTHEGKVTLRGVPGASTNKTRLGANTTLLATVHRDSDGDGRFDRLRDDGDAPYVANGTAVNDSASITVPQAERPQAANVTVTNQTTNGTTVTVDSVTLPDGGYVGVHRGGYNGSNATQSAVGATEYLGPGTYENVTVPVGSAAVDHSGALTDSGRISVVVYEDTDGDRTFQYVPSGGVEDQPYLADGEPVAESASLTVERPETPTPTRTAQPTETSAPTPTEEPPTPAARDRTTAYGGPSNARDGILENPLFPLFVLVFAIFAVLVAVGGR